MKESFVENMKDEKEDEDEEEEKGGNDKDAAIKQAKN